MSGRQPISVSVISRDGGFPTGSTCSPQPGITPLVAKWPGTFPAHGEASWQRDITDLHVNGAASCTPESFSLSNTNATDKMADSSAEDTVSKTITDLETRLKRIEFVTTGQNCEQDEIAVGKGSATARLRDLEHKLDQVTSRSRAAQDLLDLCASYSIYRRHKPPCLRAITNCKTDVRYPDLFPTQDQQTPAAALDPSSLLAIILSSASSCQLTVSRLISILDVPVPEAEASTNLIDLQPRIAHLELLQAEHEKELAELKGRSAAILQRWYAIDILGVGDCWAEVEGRVTAVEQTIRRADLAREKDAELV